MASLISEKVRRQLKGMHDPISAISLLGGGRAAKEIVRLATPTGYSLADSGAAAGAVELLRRKALNRDEEMQVFDSLRKAGYLALGLGERVMAIIEIAMLAEGKVWG